MEMRPYTYYDFTVGEIPVDHNEVPYPIKSVAVEEDQNIFCVKLPSGKWQQIQFTDAGELVTISLFYRKKEHKGWINIYKSANGSNVVGSVIHPDLDTAISKVTEGKTAIQVEISWKE